MDKYDDLVMKMGENVQQLSNAVLILRTQASTNHTWIMALLSIFTAVIGAGVGSGLTLIITHLAH